MFSYICTEHSISFTKDTTHCCDFTDKVSCSQSKLKTIGTKTFNLLFTFNTPFTSIPIQSKLLGLLRIMPEGNARSQSSMIKDCL